MKELVKEVHGQDAGDFSSWAGLKPRNDQSNKTIKSRRITHGNRYLRRITMHHNYAFLWVLLLVQGNDIRFYRGKVLLTLRMSTILPPYRHIIHPTLVKNHLHFHTFLPKILAQSKLLSYLCSARTPKPLNNAQIGGRFI